MTGTDPQPYLDLVDWRRRVGDLYRITGPDAVMRFRGARDELFRTHPQSPIEREERDSFTGLRYFDTDPACRVTAHVEPGDDTELGIDTGGRFQVWYQVKDTLQVLETTTSTMRPGAGAKSAARDASPIGC